ncbi:MAG: hypothetical protein CVV52_08060 [Spirochaetae bacterium HGW-Spirochaetae-8]|nr:MAG: hypothetical protein CVV52_08060 [Spirochaetae bacterium HGW-Spirochaetae-8]
MYVQAFPISYRLVYLPSISTKAIMKGIITSGQTQESGGFASISAPRSGVFHHAFPPLDRERPTAVSSVGSEHAYRPPHFDHTPTTSNFLVFPLILLYIHTSIKE